MNKQKSLSQLYMPAALSFLIISQCMKFDTIDDQLPDMEYFTDDSLIYVTDSALLANVEEYYLSLNAQPESYEALEQTAAWVASQTNVAEAGVGDDSSTIYVTTDNGITLCYMTSLKTPPGSSLEKNLRVFKKDSIPPMFDEVTGVNMMAWLFTPFATEFGNTDETNDIAMYYVDPTHQAAIGCQIFSEDYATISAIKAALSGMPPQSARNFLQRYVHINACYSFHESIKSAFLETGALCYSGYSHKVSCPFGKTSVLEYYKNLSECQTVQESFDLVSNKSEPQ